MAEQLIRHRNRNESRHKLRRESSSKFVERVSTGMSLEIANKKAGRAVS